MFQSLPRLTLPSFRQFIGWRSALLFTVAFFTVVMSPMIADRLATSFTSFDVSAAMPFQSAVMNPHLAANVTTETANFPLSLTHQEPNFYQ
jgi:hypothetical protein